MDLLFSGIVIEETRIWDSYRDIFTRSVGFTVYANDLELGSATGLFYSLISGQALAQM